MGDVVDLSKLRDPRIPSAALQQPQQQLQLQIDPNGQVIVSEQELQFYLKPVMEKLQQILDLLDGGKADVEEA